MKSRPPEPTTVTATIPTAILEDAGLSCAAKLLFGTIYALAISHPKCFISNFELSRRLCFKRRYVQILLKSLEARGLILREYDEETHREQIVIAWRPGTVVIGHRRSRVAHKPAPKEGGAAHNRAQGGALLCAGANLLENKPIEKDPPNPPETGGRVGELLRRAKEIGLAGATAAKVQAAVDQFGADRVARAIDSASGKAERWGWVVAALKRWEASGVAPFVAKREPKRPEDLPAPRPPPPADDAIDGSEAAAKIRATIASLAKNLASQA